MTEKRMSLLVGKIHEQSGFDWVLGNSRYIMRNISTDSFLELAPGEMQKPTLTAQQTAILDE